MKRKRTTVLEQVLRHYGYVNAMSRAFGISRQAISHWDKVPMKHLARVSSETGIPRQELRPDLYEDS